MCADYRLWEPSAAQSSGAGWMLNSYIATDSIGLLVQTVFSNQ